MFDIVPHKMKCQLSRNFQGRQIWLTTKSRINRKREKIIAAVSVVAFVILVIISSLLMLQDAERAVDGNVELEYPIGDGENAAENTERFSDVENKNYLIFGDDTISGANSANSNVAVDTKQILP